VRNGNELRLLLTAGTLLLLLAGFNLFWLTPRLTWRLPQPEPLPSLAELPPARPSDRVENTLSLIRKLAAPQAGKRSAGPPGPRPGAAERNPFLDPAAGRGAAGSENATRPDTNSDRPPPRVQMVIIGERHRHALVDNRLVRAGQLLYGQRILKIVRAGVWLKTPDGPRLLPLGSYVATRSAARSRKREEEKVKAEKNRAPAAGELRRRSIRELLRQLEPILNAPANGLPAGPGKAGADTKNSPAARR